MDGIGRLGNDPPRESSADWRVLTAADADGINGLRAFRSTEELEIEDFWSPILPLVCKGDNCTASCEGEFCMAGVDDQKVLEAVINRKFRNYKIRILSDSKAALKVLKIKRQYLRANKRMSPGTGTNGSN
ncbi:hypothetical protein evm_013605 [Chilo suppressalis]|nr:hypothetical protein evm_013605 [Chilo suppressalis]